MKKSIAVLGSTGSVGTQALEVASHLGLPVAALTANSNITLLEKQIRKYSPPFAAVCDKTAAKKLRIALSDFPVEIADGVSGVCEAALRGDTVLNSIVGMAGLLPTLAAANAGKTIATANKEALVTGGLLVTRAVKEHGGKLLPVDSEHSAIFQCLEACRDREALKKIILTASGGPFFGKTKKDLCAVTAADALCHPTWSMGKKITVDCATMMNKGLEIIEAAWLFSLPQEKIDVVIHRESVIHSLIEFCDNSVLAQLGAPDMRLPIQYALTYPDRLISQAPALSLTEYGKLTFYPPDSENFPCLSACRRAFSRGGLVPAAVNGANEAAVKLFLSGKLSFTGIGELVSNVSETFPTQGSDFTVDDVLAADKEGRAAVLKEVKV